MADMIARIDVAEVRVRREIENVLVGIKQLEVSTCNITFYLLTKKNRYNILYFISNRERSSEKSAALSVWSVKVVSWCNVGFVRSSARPRLCRLAFW